MRRLVTVIVSTLLAVSAMVGVSHLADTGAAQAGGFGWPGSVRG